MKINAAGVDIVKRWEGCKLSAYLCPAGVPTIGYGHTGDVKIGQKITQHQAEVILALDLEEFEEGVSDLMVGTPLTENEFSALVSFAFNVGITALSKSTLRRKIASGNETAPDEFLKWTRAGGKILPGLVSRRAEERALYVSNV